MGYGGMGCKVWKCRGVEVWRYGTWESELYLSHGNFEVPTGKQKQELQETYESLEIRQGHTN